MFQKASSSQSDKVLDAADELDFVFDIGTWLEPDPIQQDQKMGDPKQKMTSKLWKKAQEYYTKAIQNFWNNNYDIALEFLTKTIEFNPFAAPVFARRGQIYLKKGRPNACVKDCNRALELNPNSGVAFKFRGRAYSLLGQWGNAAKDLRQACSIDFDSETDGWLKEIAPNVKIIEEYNLKKKRKIVEMEGCERVKRMRAQADASGTNTEHSNCTLFEEPIVMAAFADPVVSDALSDILWDPANFYKYRADLKLIAQLIELSKKFAETGEFPGFPSGGFPGSDKMLEG